MADGPVDGEMIEIGDLTEEPAVPEIPPQVVIQYHERGGVPWMLIPPLLLISAVAAVVLYSKFAPSSRRPAASPTVLAGAEPAPAVEAVTPEIHEAVVPSDPPGAQAVGPPAIPVAAIEVSPSPTIPVDPPAEPPKLPEPQPEATPPRREQALGFDPRAFDTERPVEAPADPALAPAVKADKPAEVEQPREVDPDLLPPDPKEARARQQQRRVDALRKVDEERLRFHADLRAACAGKFREGTEDRPGTAEKIVDLKKDYETKIDPLVLKKAAALLGKNGKFVGADRRTRIELLRALGYPEPAILGDLYDNYGVKSLNERDGPRTYSEALYQSALMLLRTPPARESASSRPVSATSPPAGNGVGPPR